MQFSKSSTRIKLQERLVAVAAMSGSSPEKAGVGGSIPSLATTLSTTYKIVSPRFHSNSFQLARRDSPVCRRGLTHSK
jgi:hypothetical protein